MKLEVNNGIIRGLPLAILVTLLLQGGSVIWWVASKNRDSVFMEQRVAHLEGSLNLSGDVQGQILQRLARLEERIAAQTLLLERIEKQGR